MKAVMVREFGGPEALSFMDVADPVPGPGEVCIEVKACTVNPTDTMRRSGASAWHRVRPAGAFALGMEAAGIIREIGAGVELQVGDAVMAVVFPSGEYGAYAERIVVPAEQVALIPPNMDFVHAATIPMNGLTALLALSAVDLKFGDILAVTGAAGTFGGYAIELAKAHGLRVIADSSPADEKLVHRLGADWIVPRGPNVAAAIRNIATEGVPALIDGSLQLEEVVPAVSDAGTLVLMRPMDYKPEERIRAVTVIISEARNRPELLPRLRRHVEMGHLTPRVAAKFPLSSADAAHRMLERGGTRGRIVLIP